MNTYIQGYTTSMQEPNHNNFPWEAVEEDTDDSLSEEEEETVIWQYIEPENEETLPWQYIEE